MPTALLHSFLCRMLRFCQLQSELREPTEILVRIFKVIKKFNPLFSSLTFSQNLSVFCGTRILWTITNILDLSKKGEWCKSESDNWTDQCVCCSPFSWWTLHSGWYCIRLGGGEKRWPLHCFWLHVAQVRWWTCLRALHPFQRVQ